MPSWLAQVLMAACNTTIIPRFKRLMFGRQLGSKGASGFQLQLLFRHTVQYRLSCATAEQLYCIVPLCDQNS